MEPIDINEIQEISIGYEDGTWVLLGKSYDKMYVLAEGKTNETSNGYILFKREDRGKTDGLQSGT